MKKKNTPKAKTIIQRLSVPVTGTTPPTEFRLLVAGENETTKGTFLFDDEAARQVMAAFEAHGVDLAIDLEHQALVDGAPADPTARDARGWFRLELRDGELWAVGVTWTEDGAARLAEKRQRYISPAFQTDDEGRVTKIINAAITAIPATHQTPALIAASQRKKKTMAETDPTATDTPTLESAIAALEAGDAEAALAMLQALATAEPEPEAEPEPGAEMRRATSTILRATSTRSLGEAASQVTRLARELQQVAAERDEFASAERIRLCRSLVHDAGHAPARVWDQEAYEAGQTPVPKAFLQRMTLQELRQHVYEELGASGKKRGVLQPAPRPPTTASAAGTPGREVLTSLGPVELSHREIQMCGELKLKIESYAEKKAIHLQARERSGATVLR